MKVYNIVDCPEISVPKGSAFTIETQPHCPKLHGIFMAIGKRASGKSTALTNLLKMYKDDPKLKDRIRILVVSPTFSSNFQLMNQLDIDEDDVYDDPDDPNIIKNIISEVEKERDDYVNYHYLLKRYNELVAKLSSRTAELDDDLLLQFYNPINGTFEPPKHKYNGKKPVMFLLADDCQQTKFYTNRKFNNLVTRHRHIGAFPEGGALGITLLCAVQNYKAQSGGASRVLRNNATHLCIFKTKDEKEISQMAEEVGGEISKELFIKAYEYATLEPHSFLFIDLHKKDCCPTMFRKRFKELIVIE